LKLWKSLPAAPIIMAFCITQLIWFIKSKQCSILLLVKRISINVPEAAKKGQFNEHVKKQSVMLEVVVVLLYFRKFTL